MKYQVNFFVNEEPVELYVDANKTMLTVLREELADRKGNLSPLQEAFIKHAALQCGFCTPGFLMTATALLKENPHPTRDEIKAGISGNLCRCTGYKRIIEAIEDVAAHTEGGERK